VEQRAQQAYTGTYRPGVRHGRMAGTTTFSPRASTTCSLHREPWPLPRFHFESFWPSVEGFNDVVAGAWSCPSGLESTLVGPSTTNCGTWLRRSKPRARSGLAVFASSWLRRESSSLSSTSPRRPGCYHLRRLSCAATSRRPRSALHRCPGPSRGNGRGTVT